MTETFCQRCMDSHPKGGVCIAELEERVVEAALADRLAALRGKGTNADIDAMIATRTELTTVIDALISARESKVRI